MLPAISRFIMRFRISLHPRRGSEKIRNSIYTSMVRREHRTFWEVNKERKIFTQQIAALSNKSFYKPQRQRQAG